MAQIVDPKLVKELMESEEKRLQERTPKSAKLYQRARTSLVKGVSSSYQVRDPFSRTPRRSTPSTPGLRRIPVG